jgi:hypothetical protein
MPVMRRCLLAAATIAALGCNKTPEAPHGAPVLIEVMWEVKGIPTRVWSRDADAMVAAEAPPQGSRVDFVFDRRLDGARVEDTVNDAPVPKANPPITAGWPDMSTVTSDPPFGATVLYNSLPDWGPGTTYAFLTPHVAGFPAGTAVTFTLDPNGLTSVYGEPMDGPTTITVKTGGFTVTLPNGSATAPTSYRVPLVFSTRAPRWEALLPFIHVLDGVTPLPFDLKNDGGDSTLLYIIPLGCGQWPAGKSITLSADQGLPDAFGRPLAIPVTGRFTTAPIGGCGTTDAGTDAAAGDGGGAGGTDAATADGGANDAGATDGGATDGVADGPDDAAQSN